MTYSPPKRAARLLYRFLGMLCLCCLCAGALGQSGRGFRVQIYMGPRSNKAAAMRFAFLKNYPDYQAYRIYESPFFKVRVGNFMHRWQAQAFCDEIKAEFPMSFVVNSPVEYQYMAKQAQPAYARPSVWERRRRKLAASQLAPMETWTTEWSFELSAPPWPPLPRYPGPRVAWGDRLAGRWRRFWGTTPARVVEASPADEAVRAAERIVKPRKPADAPPDTVVLSLDYLRRISAGDTLAAPPPPPPPPPEPEPEPLRRRPRRAPAHDPPTTAPPRPAPRAAPAYPQLDKGYPALD